MEIKTVIHGVKVEISESSKTENREQLYEVTFNDICIVKLTLNQWRDINELIDGGMTFMKKMSK